MSFYKHLKNAARASGIRASNRTLNKVVDRVERIQAQYDRPATVEEMIELGLRFLTYSDPTGETAVNNIMKEEAA